MQVPLEITFRDMDKSDSVEERVREHVDRLEKFCDHIDSCRVALEQPHRHHKHGSGYRVRIDLRIPGHEIVVDHHPNNTPGVHDDLHRTVHEAFKLAERRVKRLTDEQRGR